MSVLVLSDDFGGPWVQVDGDAVVIDMPEAADALVDYYRAIAGEHPDWDEYRQAMIRQDKSLLRITPTSWAPSPPADSPPVWPRGPPGSVKPAATRRASPSPPVRGRMRLRVWGPGFGSRARDLWHY